VIGSGLGQSQAAVGQYELRHFTCSQHVLGLVPGVIYMSKLPSSLSAFNTYYILHATCGIQHVYIFALI